MACTRFSAVRWSDRRWKTRTVLTRYPFFEICFQTSTYTNVTWRKVHKKINSDFSLLLDQHCQLRRAQGHTQVQSFPPPHVTYSTSPPTSTSDCKEIRMLHNSDSTLKDHVAINESLVPDGWAVTGPVLRAFYRLTTMRKAGLSQDKFRRELNVFVVLTRKTRTYLSTILQLACKESEQYSH